MAEPWQEIWTVFERAAELPEDGRRAFLDRACGTDDVRRAVEALLAADREPATLAAPGPVAGGTATEDAPADVITAPGDPETIGPYRILRRVGQGGMSTAYLAARAGDFERRVVVKVIRRGMESEELLRRLRVERQILADLDHPHVARLYDGGSTADGLPYFVMEHVEGLPIDAYCEQNRLSIDRRLTLFRKVCAAVHYAHQNLVVHRDVKPSNVLVTAGGEPKLLDFGIAKLLDPELAGGEHEATATWQRLMTPSYASPEQIRGRPITTASDVYSLGVLLYQLLTGSLPRRFGGRSLGEIEQMLTEEEPPPPSLTPPVPASAGESSESGDPDTPVAPSRAEVGRAAGRRRRLAVDLDSIALKALRTEPRDRYGSVERLAADVERYQNGLPVLARQGDWRYRAGKFLRRNRGAIAAAAVVVLLLVTFVAALALQSARVARERDRVRLERDKKQQVLTLVSELFELADPYAEGVDVTVLEALDRGVPLLESRLRDQPEVRAELLYTSGTILGGLGLYQQARKLLEEALAIRRELHGERHGDVATTLTELAAVHTEQGEYELAEAHARRAVAITRELHGGGHPDLVAPLNELVRVLCHRDQFLAAEESGQEAFSLAQSLRDDDPAKLIDALELRARIHSGKGEYRQTVELSRRALELRRSHNGEDDPGQHLNLHNMGLGLRRLGELEGAERAYREALAIVLRAFGKEHPEYAYTLNNLAGVHYARGEYAAAEAGYRETREVFRAVAGPEHWRVFFTEIRVQKARIRQGAATAAENDLRRALARWRPRLGDHWVIAEAESVLGESVSVAGRCEEAEPFLVESFLRLCEGTRERTRRDAFDRLREHLERCGKTDEIAGYEALLTPLSSSDRKG